MASCCNLQATTVHVHHFLHQFKTKAANFFNRTVRKNGFFVFLVNYENVFLIVYDEGERREGCKQIYLFYFFLFSRTKEVIVYSRGMRSEVNAVALETLCAGLSFYNNQILKLHLKIHNFSI